MLSPHLFKLVVFLGSNSVFVSKTPNKGVAFRKLSFQKRHLEVQPMDSKFGAKKERYGKVL